MDEKIVLLRFLKNWQMSIVFYKFALSLWKTSNEIIAGNDRILSEHEYCVAIFVWKNNIMLMSYFLFFLLMHYTVGIWIRDLSSIIMVENSLIIEWTAAIQITIWIPDNFVFAIQMPFDKILVHLKITWVTLGKLPWNGKIPLPGNGMAAILKTAF